MCYNTFSGGHLPVKGLNIRILSLSDPDYRRAENSRIYWPSPKTHVFGLLENLRKPSISTFFSLLREFSSFSASPN
jgi:hypothetical protein